MKTRVTAIVMCLLLALALFSGCNVPAPPATSTAPQSTAPQSAAQPSPAPSIGGQPKDTGPTPAQPLSVTVENQLGQTIWQLYISPTTASGWGDDLLETALRHEDIMALPAPASDDGTYDVKAVDDDGITHIFNSVPLSSDVLLRIVVGQQGFSAFVEYEDGTWLQIDDTNNATQPPLEPDESQETWRISVTNHMYTTAVRVYIRYTGEEAWGEDLMGSGVLDHEAWQPVDIQAGGYAYDAYVTDTDGNEHYFFGLTLAPGYDLSLEAGQMGMSAFVYDELGTLVHSVAES